MNPTFSNNTTEVKLYEQHDGIPTNKSTHFQSDAWNGNDIYSSSDTPISTFIFSHHNFSLNLSSSNNSKILQGKASSQKRLTEIIVVVRQTKDQACWRNVPLFLGRAEWSWYFGVTRIIYWKIRSFLNSVKRTAAN